MLERLTPSVLGWLLRAAVETARLPERALLLFCIGLRWFAQSAIP
jgi:hypothetical protein